MEINYVDYTDHLLKAALGGKEPKVYLVADNYQKQEAKQLYQTPLLAPDSLFLTREELKERLFLTDQILLKEEKRVLMFYQVLTDEDKEQLGIESYFDVIELANDVFHFYDQLQEYNITQLNDLAAWQQERYERLQSIRDRYKSALNEEGYTDRTLANDFANFSLQCISDYRQVVVINILDLTPLEKEMLRKIEAAGKEVRLYCQVDSSDFNEQDLTLESITLPPDLQPEVEIYETTDQFLEVVNFLVQLEQQPEDYEVLDAAGEASDSTHLLSPEQFNLKQKRSFEQTKLYRFLAGLHALLTSSDQSQGELKLSLKQLREVSCQQGFKDYYGLKSEHISWLNQLGQQGYVYLSEALIAQADQGEKLLPVSHLIDDLEEISQLTDLAALIAWLTDLELETLLSGQVTDVSSKYFQSLSELEVIAEMELVSSWRDYFADTAAGLWKLVLRHLRYKEVTTDCPEDREQIEYNHLAAAGYQPQKNLVLLNAAEGTIPQVEGAGFLLTDQQRKDLKLNSAVDKRLQEKYKFFRPILGADKVIIFTLENEEQNLTASSFVEQLELEYGLSAQEAPLGEKEYSLILQELFAGGQEEVNWSKNSQSQWELPAVDSDFNAYLSLGFYKYQTLQSCPRRFYFEHLADLEPEWEPIEKKLNKRILGSLVHNIFEAVITKIQPQLEAGRFNASEAELNRVIEQEIINQRLKIPKYYENYYQKVLFPTVKEAVKEFLAQLKEKVGGEIEEVLAEWRPERTPFLSHSRTDVSLSGRIDLVVETAEQNYLIDYKTGGGSEEQLDFYSLLFSGEQTVIDRSIYDVMEQEFAHEKVDSAVEFKEKIRDELTSLLASEKYQSAASYQCTRCDYQAVCRVVEE